MPKHFFINFINNSAALPGQQGERERERGDGQQPIPCSGADNNYLAWHSGGWSMTDLQQTKNTFGRFSPLNRI